MHTTKGNRRTLVTAAIALIAFGAPGIGTAAASPSAGHTSRKIPVHAQYVSPPDTFTVAQPCTVDDYIPETGLCHGSESGTATISGSWVGTAGYDFGWVVDPAGMGTSIGLSTVSGTVTGCGTGTFTYRFVALTDVSGTAEVTWEIIPRLGTGDLAGLTGHGTEHGTVNADLSSSADITGVVRCGQHRPQDT